MHGVYVQSHVGEANKQRLENAWVVLLVWTVLASPPIAEFVAAIHVRRGAIGQTLPFVRFHAVEGIRAVRDRVSMQSLMASVEEIIPNLFRAIVTPVLGLANGVPLKTAPRLAEAECRNERENVSSEQSVPVIRNRVGHATHLLVRRGRNGANLIRVRSAVVQPLTSDSASAKMERKESTVPAKRPIQKNAMKMIVLRGHPGASLQRVRNRAEEEFKNAHDRVKMGRREAIAWAKDMNLAFAMMSNVRNGRSGPISALVRKNVALEKKCAPANVKMGSLARIA